MDKAERPRLLCVDDDPKLLAGLEPRLRKSFDVVTCTDPTIALAQLDRDRPFAAVISDMRMPGMDGASFLEAMRRAAPSTVRVLLTGYASIESAAAAVNRGEVFRFLSKPCSPIDLQRACDAAVEQHRLITSERELRQKTLLGMLQIMTDALALVSPLVFGRATRIRQFIYELRGVIDEDELWTAEVALLATHVAMVHLPVWLAERLYHGEALSDDDLEFVQQSMRTAETLVSSVPRLERVRDVIRQQFAPWTPNQRGGGQPASAGSLAAQVLRLATDFDALLVRGETPVVSLATLRGRDVYDSGLLHAMEMLHSGDTDEVREISLLDVHPGMRILSDVVLPNGTLFIPRGYVVSVSTLDRIAYLDVDCTMQYVRVSIPEPAR
jgi:CheY-like chemotaxis protein